MILPSWVQGGYSVDASSRFQPDFETFGEDMKSLFLTVIFIFGHFLAMSSIAGADEVVSFKLTGGMNLVYGTSSISYSGTQSHAMYLNLGGPNLSLTLDQTSAGVSFFPSLKMLINAPVGMNTFSTALGFGPFVSYHKFVLSMPFYFTSPSVTDVGLGFGYRF